MKLLHKAIIIISLASLLLTSLMVPSFAQAINGSTDGIREKNLLLVPRMAMILKYEDFEADGSTNGFTFNTDPIFKPSLAENSSQLIYSQSRTAANFTGYSYMNSLTQRVTYKYSGAYFYEYKTLLTYGANAGTIHPYYGQFRYESFRLRHGIHPNAWIMYLSNVAGTYARVVRVTLDVLAYDENEGYKFNTISKEYSLDYTDRVNIRNIYDQAVEGGAYTGLSEGIIIKQMIITNVTLDGSIYTVQDEESIGGSIYQYFTFPLITDKDEARYPALLEWLSVAIGGFFDTTIFRISNIPVTIGGLFLVPISAWVVIAFLKKFAGG